MQPQGCTKVPDVHTKMAAQQETHQNVIFNLFVVSLKASKTCQTCKTCQIGNHKSTELNTD